MFTYHEAIRLESRTTLANFKRTGIHRRTCASLHTSPAYGSNGFVYDVAIIHQCDCFMSLPIPDKHSERVKILKAMGSELPTHAPLCAHNFYEPSTYRGQPVWMRLACNCWMSIPVEDEK